MKCAGCNASRLVDEHFKLRDGEEIPVVYDGGGETGDNSSMALTISIILIFIVAVMAFAAVFIIYLIKKRLNP
jgi:cell division protein FtsX